MPRSGPLDDERSPSQDPDLSRAQRLMRSSRRRDDRSRSRQRSRSRSPPPRDRDRNHKSRRRSRSRSRSRERKQASITTPPAAAAARAAAPKPALPVAAALPAAVLAEPTPAMPTIPARLSSLAFVERRALVVYGPTLFRTPELARKMLLRCTTELPCANDLRDAISKSVSDALCAVKNALVVVAWPHFYDQVASTPAAPGVAVSAAPLGANSPFLTRYRINTRAIVDYAVRHSSVRSTVLPPLPYERAVARALHKDQDALFPLDLPSACSLAAYMASWPGTDAVLMCGFDDDDSASGKLDFLATSLGRFVCTAGLRQTHRYWAACTKLAPSHAAPESLPEIISLTKHMFQKLVPSTTFTTVTGRWAMVQLYEGASVVRSQVADPAAAAVGGAATAGLRAVLLGVCWNSSNATAAQEPVNDARWLLTPPPQRLVAED